MKIYTIKNLALCVSAACVFSAHADTQSVVVLDKENAKHTFLVDTENGYLKTTATTLEIYENLQISDEARVFEYANINKVLFNQGTSNTMKVISGENISVFPNPASEFVNIANYNGNEACELYSIDGKFICAKEIKGKRINISDLASGEYILKIGDKSFKLIKK